MNSKENTEKELNKSIEKELLKKLADTILEKFSKNEGFNKTEFLIKELRNLDNKPKENKTYGQDWKSYNQAQQKEKVFLIHILNELLNNISFPKTVKVGRNPIPLKDKIFYLVLQAYNQKSSRRCISDLELCKRLNFVDKTPHFNTILSSLKDTEVTKYLTHLIRISGAPLQQVEQDFAIDSSGFSTCQFDRWFNIRTGKDSDKRRFKKLHMTCGVKTNIITAINITPGNFADSPQFENLVKTTKEMYDIREVSADKAYISRKNLQLVSDMGGIPFIPFKKNARRNQRGVGIWKTMYDFYILNQQEFLEHYHKRSNSETVFHMIKMKFGAHLKTKNNISQTNEILSKCLAHNICVLIQEMFEIGIKIDFNKCANLKVAHN